MFRRKDRGSVEAIFDEETDWSALEEYVRRTQDSEDSGSILGKVTSRLCIEPSPLAESCPSRTHLEYGK